MPSVITEGGSLLLDVIGGADALHDFRRFTVPLREDHLDALRSSLRRRLLLHAALLPLCDDAGIRGPWDERAALLSAGASGSGCTARPRSHRSARR